MTRNLILSLFVLLCLNSCKKDPAPGPVVPAKDTSKKTDPVDTIVGTYTGQVNYYYHYYLATPYVDSTATATYAATFEVIKLGPAQFKLKPSRDFYYGGGVKDSFYVYGFNSSNMYATRQVINNVDETFTMTFKQPDSLNATTFRHEAAPNYDKMIRYSFAGK
jgi:hypothetical protein